MRIFLNAYAQGAVFALAAAVATGGSTADPQQLRSAVGGAPQPTCVTNGKVSLDCPRANGGSGVACSNINYEQNRTEVSGTYVTKQFVNDKQTCYDSRWPTDCPGNTRFTLKEQTVPACTPDFTP